MATNMERRLQAEAGIFGNVGRGVQARNGLSPMSSLHYKKFDGGVWLADSEYEAVEGTASEMIDMTANQRDALRPMPGIIQVENHGARVADAMFNHPALDGTSEIVFFDAPFMGIKTGATTAWYNVALPAGNNWVAALHGDQLIFSNGVTTVFARGRGDVVVENLSFGPCTTIASFAGRVWFGGITDGGIFQPLGLYWSGATSLYSDLTGLGAGGELLLDDVSDADSIVALRAMSFDLMAIIMRRSVWVGRRTGDPLRPADFSPRVTGAGAVNEETVRNTEVGVMFLSDSGVKLFDGNSVVHMSQAIDSDLVPLDYTQLRSYTAVYSPLSRTYRLFAPGKTYTYSFQYQRWEISSAIIDRAVALFNAGQSIGSSLPAGWGEYWGGSWSEQYQNLITVNDILFQKGTLLGIEDLSARSYFGVPQTCVWAPTFIKTEDLDSIFNLHEVELQYSAGGTIALDTQALNGDMQELVNPWVIPPSNGARRYATSNFVRAGRSLAVRIRVIEGSPIIHGVRVTGRPRGRVIA